MSIWRRPATYDESRGPVSAWVLGVVRNRAIDQTRRNKHHDRLRASEDALELHPAAVDVGEQVATRSDADEMRSRLALLPEAQREVIVLAYYGQLTHEEIAVHLHIPPGTVKGRIRLALAKLRAGHRDFAV